MKPTAEPETAGTSVFRTVGPFCLEVMDVDFVYRTTVVDLLRKYAREQGFELNEIVINCTLESSLDRGDNTSAKEEQKFEIRRKEDGRLVGIFTSRATIRQS